MKNFAISILMFLTLGPAKAGEFSNATPMPSRGSFAVETGMHYEHFFTFEPTQTSNLYLSETYDIIDPDYSTSLRINNMELFEFSSGQYIWSAGARPGENLNVWVDLYLTSSTIYIVKLSGESSGVGDVTFYTELSPAPEPGTYILLLMGLSLLPLASRRRKNLNVSDQISNSLARP